MKNLVISRKGIDPTSGGRASPILANGDIFLLPIPQKKFLYFYGTTDFNQIKSNTIYIASRNLTFSDRVRDQMGHGTFKKLLKI